MRKTKTTKDTVKVDPVVLEERYVDKTFLTGWDSSDTSFISGSVGKVSSDSEAVYGDLTIGGEGREPTTLSFYYDKYDVSSEEEMERNKDEFLYKLHTLQRGVNDFVTAMEERIKALDVVTKTREMMK